VKATLDDLIGGATRFLFFTGKGGVGKTSLACAVATALADSGRKVLLVSTDPASNLDEVFAAVLQNAATPVPGISNLCAMNIDPEAAAEAYREKMISPVRGLLPDAALRSMEEHLSGACTMEIAAFDEFARLLGDEAATSDFQHVVFDTAPTGHTLRLLALPGAWTGFFDGNASGMSCLGPLAGLEQQRTIYAAALEALADIARTTVVLVSRTQTGALREAERTRNELAALGIARQILILNAIFTASDDSDPVAAALERRGSDAVAAFREFLDSLPVASVPMRSGNLLGVASLRALVHGGRGDGEPRDDIGHFEIDGFEEMGALIDELASRGRGLIMTLGKGGVGKTTIAAALAVELAERGHDVHLSTTDPASHVRQTLGGSLPNLRVSRIDPSAETEAYTRQVVAEQGSGLDAEGRELLEEDLRSPCTTEIAVFRAFSRTVANARNSFVILDTAPTGHTLLLLDATAAYHRELGRQAREGVPEEVRSLLGRLRDPVYTSMLIVTVPEATPVHEAAALQADLRRAGIEPFAWIVNQSFSPLAITDPLLRRRAQGEHRYLREVTRELASRAALIPWRMAEPAGLPALRSLFDIPLPATLTLP